MVKGCLFYLLLRVFFSLSKVYTKLLCVTEEEFDTEVLLNGSLPTFEPRSNDLSASAFCKYYASI